MAWKCIDDNCDYCEHPLYESNVILAPYAIVCDMLYGGHYCSEFCFRSGRTRIQKRITHVTIGVPS